MTSTTKTFTLNTGTEIPVIGFGTWLSTEEVAYNSILTAIKAGYRHIDTASIYCNEKIIGKAIKDSKIPRDELYVTTKLWTTHAMNLAKTLQNSLDKLSLDYVDLYLTYYPVPTNPKGDDPLYLKKEDGTRDIIAESEWSYIDTYTKMEEFLKNGEVKSVGVCNMTIKQLEKLLEETTIVPAVLHVEL